MKRAWKGWAAMCLAGVLALVQVGCGRRGGVPPTAAEVLEAMRVGMVGSEALSVGMVYRRDVATEEKGYLSDTLFSALYGEAARGLLQAKGEAPSVINDVAICLSAALSPVELAVFRCSDARGTATAAGLCRARLDTVRRGWAETDRELLAAGGVVVVEGSYVFLVIAEDPEAALRAGKRLCS